MNARGITFVFAAFLLMSCAADDPLPEVAPFPPVAPGVTRPTEIEDLTGQAVVEIDVGDNVFAPRAFRVDPGAEIVFTNSGINPHNVTPAAAGAFERIDEAVLKNGPATLTLDAPGDYPFYCSIHGASRVGQTGFVIVGSG